MIGLALVDLIWPFEIQLQSSVLEGLILIFHSSMVFCVVKAVVAAQVIWGIDHITRNSQCRTMTLNLQLGGIQHLHQSSQHSSMSPSSRCHTAHGHPLHL